VLQTSTRLPMWCATTTEPTAVRVTFGHIGGIAGAAGPADRPNCTGAVCTPFTDRS